MDQRDFGWTPSLRIKAGEWTRGYSWGGPIVGQKKKGIVIHSSELCRAAQKPLLTPFPKLTLQLHNENPSDRREIPAFGSPNGRLQNQNAPLSSLLVTFLLSRSLPHHYLAVIPIDLRLRIAVIARRRG